jgi:hypothetical protein
MVDRSEGSTNVIRKNGWYIRWAQPTAYKHRSTSAHLVSYAG